MKPCKVRSAVRGAEKGGIAAAPIFPSAGAHLQLARIVVLGIGLLLLTRSVTGWFVGMHEVGTAAFSIWARNHIQYGLGYTKLFCVWGEGAAPPAEAQRYLDRPPLIAAWVALPMLVFGEHEWVGRMVIIAATLISTWILMVMVSRLQGEVLGWLSGLFYVALPIVGYFGRVLQYETFAPVFSLLMLHGYLQWVHLYGREYSSRVGFFYYVVGNVLGIGSDWSPAVMAGLIGVHELCRWLAGRSSWRTMMWLTLTPGVCLGAVFLHILSGCDWDLRYLVELFASRSFSNPIPWADWLARNWMILLWAFSAFGLAAAVIYLALIPAILRLSNADSPFRQIVPNGQSVVPVLLTGIQGLIWVVLFKRQSYIHEFWQYMLAPFVAVGLASIVVAAYVGLWRWSSRWAAWGFLVLLLVPMPSMTLRRDAYFNMFSDNIRLRNRMAAYVRLGELVPPRVAVMASEPCPPGDKIVLSRYRHQGPFPNLAYYMNRPVIPTTDLGQIEAHRNQFPAYVLELMQAPDLQELARQLAAKYAFIRVGNHHLIFDLTRRKG